jgi:YhcH/YjgK/YiaL family protein
MYYLVQKYETKTESEGYFEAHRKFIDLQDIVSGKERHGYAPLSFLKQRDPYNEEKDLVIYDGKGSFLTLDEGFFAIYFPEDGHMPNIRTGTDPEKMVKVVVKIPV